jgi:hypothetical protein
MMLQLLQEKSTEGRCRTQDSLHLKDAQNRESRHLKDDQNRGNRHLMTPRIVLHNTMVLLNAIRMTTSMSQGTAIYKTIGYAITTKEGAW